MCWRSLTTETKPNTRTKPYTLHLDILGIWPSPTFKFGENDHLLLFTVARTHARTHARTYVRTRARAHTDKGMRKGQKFSEVRPTYTHTHTRKNIEILRSQSRTSICTRKCHCRLPSKFRYIYHTHIHTCMNMYRKSDKNSEKSEPNKHLYPQASLVVTAD